MALADYIYQKAIIEAERLVLRPMNVTDVPSLKEWMVNTWCDYYIYGKLVTDK